MHVQTEVKPVNVRLSDSHVDKSMLLPDVLLARAPKPVKDAQAAADKAIDAAVAVSDKYGSEVFSDPRSTDEERREAEDATRAAWKDAWKALYAYAGALHEHGDEMVAAAIAEETDARTRVAQAALELARARADADNWSVANASLTGNRGEPRDLRFDHRDRDVAARYVRQVTKGVQPPHFPAAVPPKFAAVIAWAVVDSDAADHWHELIQEGGA